MIMKHTKKIAVLLAAILSVASFAACGSTDDSSSSSSSSSESSAESSESSAAESSEESSKEESTTATESAEDSQKLQVERGDGTTTVTIPADLISDQEATVSAADSNPDVVSYTVNDDGSITYVYTNEAYQKIVDQMRTKFDDTVTELLGSGKYKTIQSIDGDDDLKNVTITVTSQQDYENGMDGFIMLGLYAYAGYYQVLVDQSEEYSVQFHLVDSATGQEFQSVTYPDDIGNKTE